MPDSRWFYKLRLRLRSIFLRSRVEHELEEELRFHIDQRVEQEIARGLSPGEARSVALRAMDGLEQQKEACRDTRNVNLIETLLQDIRYTFRGLSRSPAYAAAAILTLALGIGASIAILTVVNSVLLRPLPFPAADRVLVLFATTPSRGVYRDTISFPDFLDWKEQSRAFTSVAAWRIDRFNVIGGGNPEPLVGLSASHELFEVLNTPPALGRGFSRQEQQSKRPVAVISHGLWQRRFGGARDVLNRSVILNDVPHAIIGVLPQGFQFPSFADTDVIVPIPEHASRSRGYLRAVARLRPGADINQAKKDLDIIAQRLEAAYPLTNQGRGINAVPLRHVADGEVRLPLLVMLGAAIFVLLIGCANVGNLVLVRGIARRRELAVRIALGAGAGRLIRQLLTESSVLALLAALLGAAAALGGSKLLAFSLSQHFTLPPVSFDWPLLALAVLIALFSGLLCGLPPALMVRKSHPGDPLKEGSRSLADGRTENRLRNLLVIGETALTVMLIAGAGLLLKSFVLLHQSGLGLNPENVVMADLLLPKRYAEPERRNVYLRDLLDSVGILPGVQRAAIHADPPFEGRGWRETFHIEGQQDPGPRQGHPASFNAVSDGFFNVMGLRVKSGRPFDSQDAPTGAPVVIVNETMARRFWPGSDPVGKRIRLYYDKDPQHWLNIVGVVADARYHGRDLEPTPQVFVLYHQYAYAKERYASLAIRTAVDPGTLIKAVQEKIWAVEKDQPIFRIQTMETALANSVSARRVYLLLLGAFAVIALLMAAAGIYGLMSYSVARRTQEVGIRIALGATVRQILGLVIRQGMLLTLIGVALGIAGSLTLTKVLSGLLYGITPTDAPTFAATSLLFIIVALAATYIPARRAATIDPTTAFRCE